MSKYIIDLNDKDKEVCEKYVNCELGDELSDYVNVTELAGAIANATPVTEGDLISRNELKKAMLSLVINENDDIPVLNAIETIDNAMSMHYTFLPQYQADLQGAYDCGYEKGKHDRPQGEWSQYNFHDLGGFGDWDYKCSKCNKVNGWKANFCPNCGAKMQKGGKE